MLQSLQPAVVGPAFGMLLVTVAIATCIEPAQGRAVNISNTWTLPQEGFSVFYRYFRDKISWFEADAVCQFHHANLVTVDNGVQFDATRAFLKELDVTSAVWIGLMRPENSARFTWTSSKALDPGSSGYWAEALPAMEQPLCAVVDPTRDFRWHALRCGGPETAAFLCELPVPSWAVDCTITSIPSLTVQYMSDSGTVQLARDCGESGTKHISCQGKQDRDSIVQQLQCSETEDLASALANDNNNNSNNSSNNSNSNRLLTVVATADADATSSSMAALQPILEHDILTVVSSNDDDVSSSSSSSSTGSSTGSSISSSSSSSVSSGPSSIDSIVINSNQIEDTVKNVIKKFDLQGLLQQQQQSGDAGPGNGESGSRRVVDESGGATSGPRKVHATGYAKKYSPLYEKKPHYVKKAVLGPDAPEELVVDDEQEQEEEEEEEEEEREREREEEEEEEAEERMMGDQPLLDETETQPIDIIQEAVKPTADGDYPLGEPAPQHPTATGLPLVLASSSSSPPGEEDLTTMTTMTTPPATTTVDSRLRRATDSGDDATTTTMTSTTSTPTTTTTTTVAPVTSTTTASHILPTTPRKEVITGDHFIPPMLLVKARFISARPHTEPPPTTVTTPQKPTTIPTVTDPTTTTGDNQLSTVHPEDVPSTLDDDGSTDGATPTQGTSNDSNDIQTQSDQSVTPSPSPSPSPSPVANNGTLATVPVGQLQRLSMTTPDVKPEIGSSSPAAPVQQEEQQTSVPTATEEHQEEEEEEHGDGDGDDPRSGTTELHNSFSNVENYQPYKPNRHRALTKAEQHHNPGNYIKKILG